MSEPLLLTKFYIPPPRPNIVRRPRLIERLNESLAKGCKLILVSASAGFGKTTLISEWVAGCNRPVAWVSLDEGDNAPTSFWAYLIAALQTLTPETGGPPKIGGANIGAEALRMLQSPQPPPIESVLTVLLNEITTIPDHFVLVLDDYHVIDSKPVDASNSIDGALTFLLEHLPPQMHLVITTREDPNLPLARLRARGQLTELRAADLRFTPAEAAEFLNRMMGLHLSDEDIAALEIRTEGWIAGLQLASLAMQGLSMQGHQDTASFIQSFTGSHGPGVHRFVLDYLVEEVLRQQPETIQTFLLRTSILNRLCGPLCNAVLDLPSPSEQETVGQETAGQETLEYLERANLFLVPLDNERGWYRYHHLFADVLRMHLLAKQPDQISSLHQRASVWYEKNGSPSDAIHHALAGEDFVRAAGLIELARPAMSLRYQSTAWLAWVRKLPEELVRTRPVLSVGYAWALLDVGELEASEARLQSAEHCLDMPTDKMVVVDQEQFRSLPASIATARANRSLAFGDIPSAIQYAQQGLERTLEDDLTSYYQAVSLLGLAQYTSGDLEAAERSLADFHASLRKTGDLLTLIGITFLLADIRVALGRLHAAESIYQQTLRLATSQGEPMHIGIADLYRGLAELSIEWGDLEAAAQYLLTSQKLGEQTATTDWPHRLCVSQARLKEAQGDLDGALALLDEAERMYVRVPLPDVRPVAALKVRIWLKQDRLAEAQGWAREQGLPAEDDIRYTREFEHITLARVLMAAGKCDREAGSLDEAARLLGRLLQAAEAGRRIDSVIQILLLQALACQAQGNLAHALTALERALTLAELEGYVRIFVDEGESMKSLLKMLFEKQARNRDHLLSTYADKLLAAFVPPAAAPKSAKFTMLEPAPLIEAQVRQAKTMLVEPLSKRELEVLKLLRTELSGPEIAEQLIVSLYTLRTHTNHIFNKLGVNNRQAAVRRAEELDLF